MLRVIILCALFLSASSLFAEEQPEFTRYCSWKANAARVIAMNRDIGLGEFELIGNYLNQHNEYEEQKIVLGLIDRIYGPYEFVSNDTIFSQTRKTCLRDFYIDPSKRVAFKQH